MFVWLQSHVYLATWLGLIVAVIAFLTRNLKTSFKDVDWKSSILYFAFLVGLGFSFVPQLSAADKAFAHGMTAFLMGAVLFNAGRS